MAVAHQPLIELSWDASEALQLHAEQYSDDELFCCNDPFNIVAELEEELGRPLALS